VCGIAGQVRGDGRAVDPSVIERMCRALTHRGPDAGGVHLTDGAALGIRRLRVIDLVTGDQPVFNEDGSVAVVLNGEIYNYRELREDLRRKGHRFTTDGDTEVIAHLYEEFGTDCVSRLHGMFAFAIWDAKARALLLARDRVGKKPLFYAEVGGLLTFASELRALLEDPEVPTAVDFRALDCFLAYGYVPAPMSAFAAVRKLPPASVLVHADGRTDIQRYWRLDFSRKQTFASTDAMHEAIRESLLASVRRRLVADVPLGALLSGGIDSSAVIAAMARVATGPVRTFSIGFENARFDELEHARAVANQFGTEHHEFVVRPEAMAMIPKIVRHYGEPFADSSAVAAFHLAVLARRHVTVVLNGDGGDETFGGYGRYARLDALRRLDRVPGALRRAGASVGRRLPTTGRADAPMSRLNRLAETLALDPAQRYIAYMSSMGGGLQRAELYTPEFNALVGESVADDVLLEPWRTTTASSLVDTMLDVDTATYLPGDLLTKIDIATMAFGLEARSPLLDHEFLELAASIPSEFKVSGGRQRIAFRDALRAWLPGELLDRPKQGFEVPVADWLRNDLRSETEALLLGPEARERGWFRAPYVRRLLDRHVEGLADNSKAIWTLLMLELWMQEVVERRPTTALLASPG